MHIIGEETRRRHLRVEERNANAVASFQLDVLVSRNVIKMDDDSLVDLPGSYLREVPERPVPVVDIAPWSL